MTKLYNNTHATPDQPSRGHQYVGNVTQGMRPLALRAARNQGRNERQLNWLKDQVVRGISREPSAIYNDLAASGVQIRIAWQSVYRSRNPSMSATTIASSSLGEAIAISNWMTGAGIGDDNHTFVNCHSPISVNSDQPVAHITRRYPPYTSRPIATTATLNSIRSLNLRPISQSYQLGGPQVSPSAARVTSPDRREAKKDGRSYRRSASPHIPDSTLRGVAAGPVLRLHRALAPALPIIVATCPQTGLQRCRAALRYAAAWRGPSFSSLPGGKHLHVGGNCAGVTSGGSS